MIERGKSIIGAFFSLSLFLDFGLRMKNSLTYIILKTKN